MEEKSSLCIGLLFFLALGFLPIIMYTWLSPKKIRTPPLPPGLLGYPIVGCIPHMLKNKPTFRWIHQLMQELNTEIACIRLGSIHVIPVTSPELAREFLKRQDSIFASRPDCMSAKLVSNGYLTTILSPTGDQWKKMRRVIASEVLSLATHRRLHGKRSEEADHLIRYIYNQCKDPRKNGNVNVRTAAEHYCGNVTRKSVFSKRRFGSGMEDGGPGMEEEEHVAGVFTILAHLYAFSVADYAPWLEAFDIDGYKKILREASKNVTKYHDPEIAERLEMWSKGLRKEEEDLLDILLNLKDSNNNPLLTVQEIKAQILEIMIAAVDNPSNAIQWVMAEMINQPDLLRRATKELDEVVGKDRLVQESDLSRLNFVKACAREGFRLHPVTAFNPPHVSTKDTIIGGYFIPKGSHVLLSRPGLGRNPRVWVDPLRYNPERHIANPISEVMLTDNLLCMLSFSTGRRGCPGVLLGSTMTTVLLARLIQGFTWNAPRGQTIDLTESRGNMFLANPLFAHATPRLNHHVYMELRE